MSFSTAAEMTSASPEPEAGAAALAPADGGMLVATELALPRPSTREIANAVAIRIFDVVVAALLLILLLPLIVLVVIAVRLESAGPAFFRCDRVGYRGQLLRMLKLRKMCHESQGLSLTIDGDARFTRIGGLLSTLKIDEIPQLFHVVRGTMSLVGPRPEVAEFVSLHPEDYRVILSVPPGITGLSQVAFFHERRILDPNDPVGHYVSGILPQKVALDRMYANRRTLALNLRILFWTAAAVLTRRQVSVDRDTGRMSIRKP